MPTISEDASQAS